jgi:phosphate-selective porin
MEDVMKKWSSVVLWCTFFLLTIVVNGFADVSPDELLQILKEKGVVTNQDLEKAKESRKRKEETPVKAYRKPKSFGIAGRVQFRYMAMENDDNHSKVTYQKDFDRPEFDGFCLRRVRLRLQGDITDDWKYHVQFSYDGAENGDAKVDPGDPDYELKKNDIGFKLQDAEINYRLHPYLNVHLGQYKTRFTTAYLTRGPNLPLCERALIIDKIAPPTRDFGGIDIST